MDANQNGEASMRSWEIELIVLRGGGRGEGRGKAQCIIGMDVLLALSSFLLKHFVP
jgi:hypothetical protein